MAEGTLILGATGKTGSLTVRRLLEEGVKVTIAGRDAKRLLECSKGYGVEAERIDIGDKDRLRTLFAEYDVVVNCVGPFTHYGYIPLAAAIESRIGYVDSAWEQEYFRRIQRYEDGAVQNGVTVITGLGVSPGISDTLVSAASEAFDTIDSITIYYVEGMRNPFSYGTMVSTAAALKSEAIGYTDGKHGPMRIGEKSKTIILRNKFGRQKLMSYPGGDIINIPKYIKTGSVEHYLGAETMTRWIFLLGRLPLGTDSRIAGIACRIAGVLQKMLFWGHKGFSVMVEIEGSKEGKSESRRVSVCTDDDPYEATAELLANGVKYMIGTAHKPGGIFSAGRILDGAQLLRKLGCYLEEGDNPLRPQERPA